MERVAKAQNSTTFCCGICNVSLAARSTAEHARNGSVGMMGLREAHQDVGVEKNCHLQAARAVDGIPVDCCIREQRRGRVALAPGGQLAEPLFRVRRARYRMARLKSLPKACNTYTASKTSWVRKSPARIACPTTRSCSGFSCIVMTFKKLFDLNSAFQRFSLPQRNHSRRSAPGRG